MKAILSNKIYLTWTQELFVKLHKELTYEFEGNKPGAPLEKITTLTTVVNKALLIPSGRMDLIPKGSTIIDKRVMIDASIPKPKFILRDSQQKFVDMIVDDEITTAICNAPVGWGKSFTGLGLAYELQLKTLIVVHTIKLREQWRDDIKEQFGFEAGIIGSGNFKTAPPIVVANVQTLAKVADKYHRAFGLILLDECHHTPSSTFTKVIASSKAMYKIGFTATIARRDQKQILTLDYFGKNNIYRPEVENTMIPKIIVVHSNHKIPGNMMTPWAIRMNQLTTNTEYQSEIVNLVKALITRGRKILILSDRVEFLQTCCLFTEKSICITSTTEDQDALQNTIKDGINLLVSGFIIFFSGRYPVITIPLE